MNNKYIIIMAGGSGERFWPKSRIKKPKQLLNIIGNKIMLIQTIEKVNKIVPKENIFLITNKFQNKEIKKICKKHIFKKKL